VAVLPKHFYARAMIVPLPECSEGDTSFIHGFFYYDDDTNITNG
jgi:hypothetical protein